MARPRQAVRDFLAFAPAYADLAEKLADAVSAHATPVGSGTVARTARIPSHERAEAAVIAWMRHQTTAYDQKVRVCWDDKVGMIPTPIHRENLDGLCYFRDRIRPI